MPPASRPSRHALPARDTHAEQHRIFPLHIVRTEPVHLGTADLRCIGVGDDGQAYYIKRVCDGPLIPVSEFLCSLLAGAIGMAIPPFHIALMPDRQEMCFASREEGGVIEGLAAFHQMIANNSLGLYSTRLAQWYAFDLFVHNVDRHANNFLFRQTSLGTTLVGLDFSRALVAEGWPGQHPPLPNGCNSRILARQLQALSPYPAPSAVATLSRLAAIPDDWIAKQLDSLPDAWVTARMRSAIARWWRGGRAKRLRLIRGHLANGRYL